MVDYHKKSFFGTNMAVIFDSGPSSSPDIFLTFIKKKKDDSWEKPSQKEGKTVKFTLEEVPFILRVVSGEAFAWNTIHSYEGQETSISFARDSEKREGLWAKVGKYSAFLNYGELEVFKALLTHVFQEKIAHSTTLSKKPNGSKSEVGFEPERESLLTITEETYSLESDESTETTVLEGWYKSETEKAVLIGFKGAKELWVPKSTIHSRYNSQKTSSQEFEIDTWLLKKNNLM